MTASRNVEPVDGWAVIDREGRVLLRTVMDTRRAAIVNWLCIVLNLVATIHTTDEQIEAAFQENRGEADVSRVRITAIAGTLAS